MDKTKKGKKMKDPRDLNNYGSLRQHKWEDYNFFQMQSL